jgi:hypothetical protein
MNPWDRDPIVMPAQRAQVSAPAEQSVPWAADPIVSPGSGSEQVPAAPSSTQQAPGRGFALRTLRGVRDPIDAGAQMLVRGVEAAIPDSWTALDQWAKREVARVDDINRGAEKDYQQNWRGGDTGFDGARLVGNLIAGAPVAAALPAGAGLSLAARTGLSALGGGVAGTLQPVTNTEDFWTEKAKQAGTGAAFGAVAAPITAGIARILSPKSSPQVQTLMNKGVTPTPGQVLGGAFKTSEEKLTSVPLLGDAIKAGQRRAIRQFNSAALDEALAPIGVKVPANMIGRSAMQHADDALGSAYDDVLNRIGAPAVDDQMLSELANLRSLIRNQPKGIADRLDTIIENEILSRTQDGRLTGEAIKAAEHNLGDLARGLRRNQDFDTSKLGDAVLETQRVLRSWLERAAPEGVAQRLRDVNGAWARFLRVQRAATSLGAEEGVFTAAQLQNAVKALDPGKRKGGFARGSALMQDLSEPAKTVLTQQVPDSGTPGRLLGSLLLGGAASGATFLNPAFGASLLPMAAYAPGAQRAVATLLAGRQGPAFKAGAEGLRTLTPALSTLLAQQLSGAAQ